MQDEDLRARQQCRVHLERRVLRGGADQYDVAGLHARKKRVLLRLVEAIDFIDENDGAAPGRTPGVLGHGHHFLDLFSPV